MKEIFLTSTILGLFLLGLVITLRSGVVSLGTSRGRRLAAENLSALLLRVAGYFAGLLALQRVIGTPSVLDW
jgi:hypothetical protein